MDGSFTTAVAGASLSAHVGSVRNGGICMSETDRNLVEVLREVVRRGAADDAARVRGLLAALMPGMPALTRVAVAKSNRNGNRQTSTGSIRISRQRSKNARAVDSLIVATGLNAADSVAKQQALVRLTDGGQQVVIEDGQQVQRRVRVLLEQLVL